MLHLIDAHMAFHLIPFSQPCLAIQNCFHSAGFEKGALFVHIVSCPNTNLTVRSTICGVYVNITSTPTL